MMIFLLTNALSILLSILAWIIIVINVSKMSLYEALCNSPGDCPVVFNKKYVIGLSISIAGAVFVCERSNVNICFEPLLSDLECD